jgi:hypothetical protein
VAVEKEKEEEEEHQKAEPSPRGEEKVPRIPVSKKVAAKYE